MSSHSVVTREEWLTARKALLDEEKELTRMRDRVAAHRRELPWVRIDTPYAFQGSDGSCTLADLFQGKSQLFVYHFMLGPDAKDPCVGCSFIADHVDSARQHFENADLAFCAVSRGTVEQIVAVKKRMGWKFPWVSSLGTTFNYDFGVSFTKEQIAQKTASYNYGTINSGEEDLHGSSVFAKDESGGIFHTYSTFARGSELLVGAFNFLDSVPKGRNESSTMSWVRHHDMYVRAPSATCCGCSTAA